jgi:creatinine amidohydrolase
MTQEDPYDAHAGNSETSEMLAVQSGLVHQDRAGQQSGVDQERMKQLNYIYSGIWWYASYPNHYGGDGSKSNAEAGELLIDETVTQLVEMIKMVKSDKVVPELQEQFFKESQNPIKTKQ